jgi:hypothetical protein
LSSLPGDFPSITITVPASDTAEGYLFLTAFRWPPPGAKASYLLILDNTGQPVYYNRLASALAATGYDFKRQAGNLLTYFDRDQRKLWVMDSTYTVTDAWQTTRGLMDQHDAQLLPNGHALLMAYDPKEVDMSQLVPGGSPTATVVGFVIQELDPGKNVVFEWQSWDHFLITDATHTNFTDTLVDYAHLNTLEPDQDGNLLILSRNMDEVTKISRETGDIMWRLGGKNNQFTFVNDPRGFSWPHDVRRLPNGHLTILDNGVYHEPQYTRAVEYEIDETNKVITLVQEYRNTPDTYGELMANAQKLPNGNMLIGWGNTNPTATEFHPDGSKAFEFTLAPGVTSYRVFRFPWHARPATPPLLLARYDQHTATLAFSWNGATDIDHYEVFESNLPHPITPTYMAAKIGFETAISFTDLPSGTHYYRVKAVDKLGNASAFSNEVEIFVQAPFPLFLPTVTKR